MSLLRIAVHQAGNTGVVTLQGVAAHLRHAEDVELAMRRLESAGCLHLLVDVGQVRWLGSPVLGVLVSRMLSVRGSGGACAMVGASSHLLRILKVTGLANLIRVHATLDEAFAALGLRPSFAGPNRKKSSSATAVGSFGVDQALDHARS